MSLFPSTLTAHPLLRPITDNRAIRFGMVGVINTAIDLILFSLLVQSARLPAAPANILSYSAGILNSFLMNRAWTFNDRSRGKAFLRSFVVFAGINLLGLAFSTLLVLLFSQFMSPILAKTLSVPLVFIWNFLASRHLAFAGVQAGQLAPMRG